MKISGSQRGVQRSLICTCAVNFSLVAHLYLVVMVSNPGPSGLCIQASVVVTLQAAGNADSTNGSSDTSQRPRKRERHPESWKKPLRRRMPRAKRIYLAKQCLVGKPDQIVTVGGSVSSDYWRRRRHDFWRPSIDLQTKICKTPTCLGLFNLARWKGDALKVPRHRQQFM